MKVIDNETIKEVLFGGLFPGDVFESSGVIHVKTEKARTLANTGELNAMRIDGCLTYFGERSYVTPWPHAAIVRNPSIWWEKS